MYKNNIHISKCYEPQMNFFKFEMHVMTKTYVFYIGTFNDTTPKPLRLPLECYYFRGRIVTLNVIKKK